MFEPKGEFYLRRSPKDTIQMFALRCFAPQQGTYSFQGNRLQGCAKTGSFLENLQEITLNRLKVKRTPSKLRVTVKWNNKTEDWENCLQKKWFIWQSQIGAFCK